LTARFLARDGVPFYIVVEPQEQALYAERFGNEQVLTLPFSNLGLGSIPARNWIKDHSIAAGHKRHWQLDDNITEIFRRYKGIKIPCRSGVAFAVVEDFSDRFTNVAISGMNYVMFSPNRQPEPPFVTNCHVYSCTLVLNEIPYRWRGRYNEDTDLCLQALAGGWCTVLVNAFLALKQTTMKMRGGNSDELYRGDGRCHMARALERMWPKVVETKRRFRRPQHVIAYSWRKFDTPLIPATDFPCAQDNYGLKLVQKKPEVKSGLLRGFIEEVNQPPKKRKR